MMMKFFCNLEVPRTPDATGVPPSWPQDGQTGPHQRLTVMALLSLLPPGVQLSNEEYDEQRASDAPPIKTVVPDLISAGYLVSHDGGALYELVHPERLGRL